MGPEDCSLDLFRGWDARVGFRILYLFDTLESQLPSIRRVLRSAKWDLTITSFSGAKQFLERETGREWQVVPQGVRLERFQPLSKERHIHFAAYGRRLEHVHKSVRDHCRRTGSYYDYTTTAALQPALDPREYYGQYAWHIRQTLFNICWPVELTHPDRVRTFSPITCRWFEAAAAANVIVGQAPQDAGFEEMFGQDLVIPIDPTAGTEKLREAWDHLWQNRERHLAAAIERRAKLSHQWSWRGRVCEILQRIPQLD